LADNPRSINSKKLEGHKEIHRLRSGQFRIIYQIKDKILLVLVLKIGHRRDIYEHLFR
jgi:mRNA interferase RelE/StbE